MCVLMGSMARTRRECVWRYVPVGLCLSLTPTCACLSVRSPTMPMSLLSSVSVSVNRPTTAILPLASASWSAHSTSCSSLTTQPALAPRPVQTAATLTNGRWLVFPLVQSPTPPTFRPTPPHTTTPASNNALFLSIHTSPLTVASPPAPIPTTTTSKTILAYCALPPARNVQAQRHVLLAIVGISCRTELVSRTVLLSITPIRLRGYVLSRQAVSRNMVPTLPIPARAVARLVPMPTAKTGDAMPAPTLAQLALL